MTLDISDTLLASSNQMNAADIMGVEPVVQVRNVSKASDPKQPIVMEITGGYKPFLPCKTVRRILAEAWGPDAGKWVGRWMQLYREPTVVYAGEEVGGLRLRALSDIPGGMTVKLKERKTGKPTEYRIAKLTPPTAQQPAERDPLRVAIKSALDEKRWSQDEIAVLLRGGKAADVPPELRQLTIDALGKNATDPEMVALLTEIKQNNA